MQSPLHSAFQSGLNSLMTASGEQGASLTATGGPVSGADVSVASPPRRTSQTSRRNRQHIYVDKSVWLELRALAVHQHESMTACVNAAIRDWTARTWGRIEAADPDLDPVQLLSGAGR